MSVVTSRPPVSSVRPGTSTVRSTVTSTVTSTVAPKANTVTTTPPATTEQVEQVEQVEPTRVGRTGSGKAGRAARTAAREREVHGGLLGVAPTLEAIAGAELKAAQALDPRVTAASFDKACDRARRASVIVPEAQTVLSGFTRVIDAKLALTPSVVQALCAAVAHKDGAPDQLLNAIDHGPGDGAIVAEHQGRDQSEEPVAMIDAALAIKDGLSLQRVHFHGLLGDLILMDDKTGSGAVDVDRTRLALLRARQLASMKAANDSGEIKGPDDLFDVLPVLQGRAMAAVERFADAVATRFGLDGAARDRVAADWHFQDPQSGQHLFFVPSRGIHDRSGGTVSLGDTIDISALVYAKTDAKPKLHPRLQS